ncbi:hypothetical protein PGB90_004863 [Kerria lacca]
MGTNLNVSTPWYKSCFGTHLQKYDSHSRTLITYPIENIFSKENRRLTKNCADNDTNDKHINVKIIGLHIVPVSDTGVKYLNEDVTNELKELYLKINKNCSEECEKCFEIVQVCFPQKIPTVNLALNNDLKNEFENRITNVPWFVLPFESIEKNVRILPEFFSLFFFYNFDVSQKKKHLKIIKIDLIFSVIYIFIL